MKILTVQMYVADDGTEFDTYKMALKRDRALAIAGVLIRSGIFKEYIAIDPLEFAEMLMRPEVASELTYLLTPRVNKEETES